MAFYQIVPKFGRQCRPICMRFGKGMCSKAKKDVPISTPWRRHGHWGQRHSPWEDFLPDVFRGRGPFRGGRGPFEEFEDLARRMEKLMTPRFFDHYYVRPRRCAEAARSEVEQVSEQYFLKSLCCVTLSHMNPFGKKKKKKKKKITHKKTNKKNKKTKKQTNNLYREMSISSKVSSTYFNLNSFAFIRKRYSKVIDLSYSKPARTVSLFCFRVIF